jgi:hypothetical protein
MLGRVRMPIDIYLGFLGSCPLLSREYVIARNFAVEPSAAGDYSIIEIRCQIADAQLILERANLFYPGAAPYIEEALRPDTGVEYRKATNADTWHYCSDCSQWPMDDYVLTPDAPNVFTICSECILKKQQEEL